MIPEFQKYPKLPRLYRDTIITEDFGFDEVEFDYPERFRRRFGSGAAQHWGLQPKALGSAGFSAVMKELYTRPILEQLLGASPLLVGNTFKVPLALD